MLINGDVIKIRCVQADIAKVICGGVVVWSEVAVPCSNCENSCESTCERSYQCGRCESGQCGSQGAPCNQCGSSQGAPCNQCGSSQGAPCGRCESGQCGYNQGDVSDS